MKRLQTLLIAMIHTVAVVSLAAQAAPSSDPQDISKLPVDVIMQRASAGNAAAEDELATRYEYGLRGLPKDHDKAMSLWLKSAEQGYAHAQWNLGVQYQRGSDRKSALVWYQKAASQGDRQSQMDLAEMYEHGWGTAVNAEQAIYWYSKAIDQGDHDAEMNLGHLYSVGEIVPRNLDLAIKFYQRAANGGADYKGAPFAAEAVVMLKAEKAQTGAAASTPTPQHTQALSPPPPSQSPTGNSGPTLAETLVFINSAYSDQGVVSFHDHLALREKPDRRDLMFDHTVTYDPSHAEFSQNDPCNMDVYNVDPTEPNESHTVRLEKIDPRSVRLLPRSVWEEELHPDVEVQTEPEIYVIVARQPPAASLPASASEMFKLFDTHLQLGYFLDKSLAERVAKAWIHAIVLCGGGSNSPF